MGVSLYEGGQLLDAWECLPEMMVVTENFQHRLRSLGAGCSISQASFPLRRYIGI
jgi:hypothetical protein